ncbi:hypothetical protein Taro_014582 [Colocasia esculenta]|uniref:Uncharacterized protein n=1 Tax=Colocasia esculenta TaxID=4460 RepID=A0A843UFB4_COLES|nr:hypothetical protein [Colocasia esculenta]
MEQQGESDMPVPGQDPVPGGVVAWAGSSGTSAASTSLSSTRAASRSKGRATSSSAGVGHWDYPGRQFGQFQFALEVQVDDHSWRWSGQAPELPVELRDFDINLGMDWLEAHSGVVDCQQKTVRFEIPRAPVLTFRAVGHASGGVGRAVVIAPAASSGLPLQLYVTLRGRVEELLVAEELWNDHKKPFIFPFSSAASCTNHPLEVDQRTSSTHKVGSGADPVNATARYVAFRGLVETALLSPSECDMHYVAIWLPDLTDMSPSSQPPVAF